MKQFIWVLMAYVLWGVVGISATGPSLNLPSFEKTTLDNGLQVWLARDTTQEAVFLSMYIPVGTTEDALGKEGSVSMMMEMLDQGTRSYSGDEITEKINEVGGTLSAGAGTFSSYITCSVLKKDTDLAIDLITELALYPTFPRNDLERIKNQALLTIKKRPTDVNYLLNYQFYTSLFSDQQRRGRDTSKESIQSLTSDELAAIHRAIIQPNGSVLVCIGDITIVEIKQTLERVFKDWERLEYSTKIEKPIEHIMTQVTVVNKPGVTQTNIMMGVTGLKQSDANYPAYRIMNYSLGGASFSSRLMEDIRTKKGLSYSIYSRMIQQPHYGIFAINTFTKNETLVETLDAIKRVNTYLAMHGITQEELDKAKSFFRGNLPMRYETPTEKSNFLLTAWEYGMSEKEASETLNRLLELQLDEVNQFIVDYFEHTVWQIVLVTDAEIVSDQLEKGGITIAKQVEIK